jgi:hypothetical protein
MENIPTFLAMRWMKRAIIIPSDISYLNKWGNLLQISNASQSAGSMEPKKAKEYFDEKNRALQWMKGLKNPDGTYRSGTLTFVLPHQIEAIGYFHFEKNSQTFASTARLTWHSLATIENNRPVIYGHQTVGHQTGKINLGLIAFLKTNLIFAHLLLQEDPERRINLEGASIENPELLELLTKRTNLNSH